jgi:hypothetical protein
MAERVNIVDVARLAQAELVARAKAGELRGSHVWTAIKGAGEYLVAIAAGEELIDDRRGLARARICQGCQYRTGRPVEIRGELVVAHYCGPAFVDRTREPGGVGGGTCGCLVSITVGGVGGQLHAAGKTTLAREKCPRGEWGV